jgi:hypothetical protein
MSPTTIPGLFEIDQIPAPIARETNGGADPTNHPPRGLSAT